MTKLIGTLLLLSAARGFACNGLSVEHGWVREPPPGSGVAAAFMTLHNTGATQIQITEVRSSRFDRVMMHESLTADGTARMVAHDRIAIAPNSATQLTPGGLHLMLMQPKSPIREGQRVDLELQCGQARGGVRVELPVHRDLP